MMFATAATLLTILFQFGDISCVIASNLTPDPSVLTNLPSTPSSPPLKESKIPPLDEYKTINNDISKPSDSTTSVLNNLPPTAATTLEVSPIIQLRKSLIQQFSYDMENMRSLPLTKLTTPCHLICKDTSNTKAWGFTEWERHCAKSLERYLRHIRSWPFSTTTHEIIPTVLLVLSWSIMILLATSKYAPPRISSFISEASLSPGLISAFLSPIALLLSIRANRAINRLMEVRTAWGVLGKAIRSLTGTIATYGVFSEEEGNEQMMKTSFLAARYLSILGWSMKSSFRKDEDDTDIIRAILPQQEADWLLSSSTKRPIAIITRLRSFIQQLSSFGYSISPTIHLILEQRLYDLESSYGISNRIFMSPIPPTYTRHTSRVLCLFLFLLPVHFAGTNTSPSALLLSVMTITYVLVGIDQIGLEIENPFPLLPMFALASTFQRNVEDQFSLLNNIPDWSEMVH